MDTKELITWLQEGLDLQQSQFDIAPEHHPEEGTPVVGYRVAYTYTDPNTQETAYGSPLTHSRADSMQQEGIWLKQSLNRTHESDDMLRSSIPIHNPKESDIGFYYFADKSMAEDYMRMIALGKVGKPHEETPINSESMMKPFAWEEDNRPQLNLTLMRVSGIADKYNPYMDIAALRREGLRMKDMHIDEHVLTIPVGEIADIGAKMRTFDDSRLGPQSLKLKQWASHW